MHDVVWKNQKQMRFIVARLLDQRNGSREMPRQNRRTDFIHTALAPARDRFDAATYRKLCAAVALVIGAESMFVFHDVLQIEEAEARKVETGSKRADPSRAARITRRGWKGFPIDLPTWREEEVSR